MQGKKEIDPYSQEWAQVDYKLQMITGKSSIQILNLYHHNDALSHQDFKTEGVIHVSDLGREYIEKAIRNSLRSEQIVFYCGHLNIHSLVRPNRVFTFLLCKLDLGKIGSAKDDLSLADSVLLESEGEKDAFQYNFMINNQTNYFVQYEVNFTLGKDKEFTDSEFACMSCQNRRAKVYCSNEQLQLCQECSNEHHGRRMMNGHKLDKIDLINSLPLCSKHNIKLKHYCSKCCKYLCEVCLQKGNSHGNSEHPTGSIQELYSSKRQINEGVTARQKDKLQGLLRSLQLKKQEIETNYIQTKKIVDGIYENALRRLSQMLLEKTFLIRSEEIELRMMNEKLEWAKTFIRFQQKNLKPIYYFQTQQKFQQELSQFKFGDLRSILYLQADLSVEGSLRVGKKQEGPVKSYPQDSRTVKRDLLQEDRSLGKQGSVYDYDSRAECPIGGQLFQILQNTKLNFFNVGEQALK